MENKKYGMNLYSHNAKAYELVNDALNNQDVAAIVHATGTGKSYVALEYALDHPEKNILYVVPYNGIIEHIKETIKANGLNLDKDFKNVTFKTYMGLCKLTDEELKNINTDMLILDEFHHIGAPIWGGSVEKIIKSHKGIKVLGMSAYTKRNRGKTPERDMVSPEADELFSNRVVSRYDLSDAIMDGVLPKPIYKSGYMYLEKTLDKLNELLNNEKCPISLKDEIRNIVYDIKLKLNKAPKVEDIFKSNIKKNGKYIYFCPLNADLDSVINEVKAWVKEMGLTENDYVFYSTRADMYEEGKINRNAFYNDISTDGKNASNKLRIMFAINQYNEGSHVPGIDGVIMGRETSSYIVYYEQLGRGLSTKGNIEFKYNYYNTKSFEELKEECKKNHINIENKSKEELVESLICPVIIDLANNIDYIKGLESEIREKKEISISEKKKNFVTDKDINPTFDTEMLNENIFRLINYAKTRLLDSWSDYYMLAEAYYDKWGNLNIPKRFKTIDGIEYDENGFDLGRWIAKQKNDYDQGLLTQDRIEMLELLNINWDLDNDIFINKFYNNKLKVAEFEGKNVNDIDDELILKNYTGVETRDAYNIINAKSFETLDEDEIVDDTLEEATIKINAARNIDDAIAKLTSREQKVINMRYGLETGYPETLEEVGKELGVTRERARQIEAKALRKLRHPHNSRNYEYIYDDDGIHGVSGYNFLLDSLKSFDINDDFLVAELYNYFNSSESDRKKILKSLCYFTLKIKVNDFKHILYTMEKELYCDPSSYYYSYRYDYNYMYSFYKIIKEIYRYRKEYKSANEYLEESYFIDKDKNVER